MHKSNKRDVKWALVGTHQVKCALCNSVPYHNAFKCDMFLAMDPLSRYHCVKRLNLCLNCLGPGHKSSDCSSVHLCKHCKVKHHTLLHRSQSTQEESTTTEKPQRAGLLTSSALKVSLDHSDVILGTAVIHIFNSRGVNIQARALLDSGSQLNFVTEKLAQHLRLARKSINVDVSGIGQAATRAQHICCITIKSRHEDYNATIDAVIIPSITSCQPAHRVDISSLHLPDHDAVADPTFHVTGQIDILIGAGIFYELLLKEQIQLNGPILQNTRLGLVVAGAIPVASAFGKATKTPSSPYKAFTSVSSECTLDTRLERFWTTEDVPVLSSPCLSPDEIECEVYFNSTTRRCPITNKYIVRLPFREDPIRLGYSEDIARKRMHSLESKLYRNLGFRTDYNEFMSEYINMKHMIPVNVDQRSAF